MATNHYKERVGHTIYYTEGGAVDESRCCIGTFFIIIGLLGITIELGGGAVDQETTEVCFLILSGITLVTFGVWMGNWSERLRWPQRRPISVAPQMSAQER
jgi:hypothetical protein